MRTEPSKPELAAERKDLPHRLAEAEDVCRAIRNGEVDAVLVTGKHGELVYTLSEADRIYRHFIETMSQGAATLSADGDILYGNILAEMLGRPLKQVVGTALRDYLPPADRQTLDTILARADRAQPRGNQPENQRGPSRAGLSVGLPLARRRGGAVLLPRADGARV